jgi:predicted secreted protein
MTAARTAGRIRVPSHDPLLGWSIAFGALALLAASPARAADDPQPMRRIDFSVQSTRQVANDWARAVVGVSEEDEDAARLADRVNQAMAWANERARAKPGIIVKSGGYSTLPIHDPRKGERRFWRASQDLLLESADARALSELLGELQSRVQLRSIEFTVSTAQRRKVEDELIDEALAAFLARAERVRERLGGRGYEIVQISIGTSGGAPPVPVMRHAAMEMDAARVAPPALEPGTTELVVHVSGSIELR